MITYKVTSPDEGEYVTADWDEAVDMALFWKCDTIIELVNGKVAAYLDIPRDKWQITDYAAAACCRRIAHRLSEIEYPHAGYYAAYYEKLAKEFGGKRDE